tara:strand:+ start:733 stop:987 length:255 start_codon:yes stop_codon:yes gene_type:complete
MTSEERSSLIDQLDRSFHAMPQWVQTACKHGMAAPTRNPETGEPFKSFRECISVASDWTLETLRDDFEDNGDLLPANTEQEKDA